MSAGAYQKLLFGVLSLVYLQPFVQAIVTTVTAGSIMAELNLNPQGMGLLGASYLFPYAASMFASGVLADCFGPRKLLAGMFTIAGAGGLIFCTSDSLAPACLGRAMTGIGTAVCMTASFTLFGRWFKPESFARVTGVFFAIGGSGAFFGAAPLSMANAAFGWRNCYGGMAGVTIFFAILVFTVIRDWPTPETTKTLGVMEIPHTRVTLKDMAEGLRTLAKDRDFRRLALWFCAMASIYQPFANLWAAPYCKDVFGLTDTQAGFAVSMAAPGFIIGCPALNWICENKLHSNRLAMGVSGMATALIFLPMFTLYKYMGFASVLIANVLLGFAVSAPNTAVYASARNIFGSRLGSIASGLMAGMSLVTGALAQLWVSAFLSFATSRGWTPGASYAFAFCLFLPACGVMTYTGFTLSRASDPGHISPKSWRMLRK